MWPFFNCTSSAGNEVEQMSSSNTQWVAILGARSRHPDAWEQLTGVYCKGDDPFSGGGHGPGSVS
jgi:hypothetical protein